MTTFQRLVLVISLAFVVRIADMYWHPFGPDEDFTMQLATSSWKDLVSKTAADTHPPFYYALVKTWFALVGISLFKAKLLSVLFSAATLLQTFFLARWLFGGAAAWAALISAAFLPWQVYWSHSARMHLLQPLFVTAIIYFSYRYLTQTRRKEWLILAALWILAIQTNYMGILFGLPWAVAFLVIEPASVRAKIQLAFTPVAGLICFLPWLHVFAAHKTHSPMTVGFFQDFISPGSLYYHSVFGYMTHLQPNHPLWYLLPASLVFCLVVMMGVRAVGTRWSFWFLLLAMPSLPVVLALVQDYTLAERHLLFCIPLFMTYWGASLAALRDRCCSSSALSWSQREPARDSSN